MVCSQGQEALLLQDCFCKPLTCSASPSPRAGWQLPICRATSHFRTSFTFLMLSETVETLDRPEPDSGNPIMVDMVILVLVLCRMYLHWALWIWLGTLWISRKIQRRNSEERVEGGEGGWREGRGGGGGGGRRGGVEGGEGGWREEREGRGGGEGMEGGEG